MSAGGIATKRMTVAPAGLNSSLGGMKGGLNFNKSKKDEEMEMNKSIPQDSEKSSIGGKLEKLDIQPKVEDAPMEDLQDVFSGKIPQNQPQEDVDMDPMEDDVAQVSNSSP